MNREEEEAMHSHSHSYPFRRGWNTNYGRLLRRLRGDTAVVVIDGEWSRASGEEVRAKNTSVGLRVVRRAVKVVDTTLRDKMSVEDYCCCCYYYLPHLVLDQDASCHVHSPNTP